MKNKLNTISDIKQFDYKFYIELSKFFNIGNGKKEVISNFTEGGCFEFAYYYNKFVDNKSKIKIIFGIDYGVTDFDPYTLKEIFDKRKIEGFDMCHTYIENEDGSFLDINGFFGDKTLNNWIKRQDGNEYGDVITLDYGQKFRNFNINEEFISKLEPHKSSYFNFNGNRKVEEKWEEFWKKYKNYLNK